MHSHRESSIKVTCATMIAVAFGTTMALGDEITVPDDVLTLSAAITLASDGDTITITPQFSPYPVVPEIAWTGKALTIRGSTGDPADVVLDGLNNNVIFRIGAGASGTVIQDLTFRNAYTNTPNLSTAAVGAALVLEGAGNVTVGNCVFSSNHADGSGAVGDARGAAIGAFGTNVTVLDCVFDDNQVTDVGADGGAIWFTTGTHLISGCTFTNNSAVDTGGALRLDNTVSQITACHFELNTCVGMGGAIWTRSSDDTVIDSSTFVNNQADTGGAIDMWSDSSLMLVRNCLFEGNQATSSGGALYPRQPMTVLNSTFLNNTSAGTRQTAAADTVSELDMYNCIIWNGTPVGDHIVPGADVRYTIVQSGYAGIGNLDADPQLDADSKPLAGSPAIDAGDTTLYAGPMVDLDGGVRGVDDPDTGDTGFSVIGPVVDMGAFEFQPAGGVDPCPIDTNGDGLIDVVDLLNVLSAWGSCF